MYSTLGWRRGSLDRRFVLSLPKVAFRGFPT